ncbi:hypothetical protein L3Q82_007066 [Scortum barcoo]|uniref:Uncharacterized protein n=1 Tax=Scortum barcoo TaxID=214431 RepID=A0ACB8WSE4_9TELE|nr:hypothetical protein L3Q82_007066 [Scortum barcoo]
MSTMEAENMVHSDSMSPASLGICEKLFRTVGVEDLPDRGLGQTFPTDPHNTFGSARPVGTNNSKRPIPNPKAQGSDPLVHRGELQHMAAELGSYKQAHTSSPPLTLGNTRVVEGPAPLEKLGSRAQAMLGGQGLGRRGPLPRLLPKPHCTGPSWTFLRVVSLLEGGPTSPFRAEPGRVPVGKDPTATRRSGLACEPQPQAWLQGGAPASLKGLFVPCLLLGLRPYHPEHARSRPISEAKQWSGLVSTWMGDRLGIPAQAAELVALTEACKFAAGKTVTIYTDSSYKKARNYYQIVKRPIDLSVIRRKLDKANTLHYFTAERFVDNVLLMFKNCASFQPSCNAGRPVRVTQQAVVKDIRRKHWQAKRWHGPFQILLTTHTGCERWQNEQLGSTPATAKGYQHLQSHQPLIARNYYQIVKRPIDLSVIRRKLDKANTLHYFTAERFVDNVLLMFKNCASFNHGLFVPCLLGLRPYHPEHARSRPISEAKQCRAWLVLGWETAWEYQVPVTKGSPAGVQHALGTGLTYCQWQCEPSSKLLLRSYRDRTALSKGPRTPYSSGALPTEYHKGHGRMPSPDPQSTCGLVGQTPINPQAPCGGYRAGPVFHDREKKTHCSS